MASEDRPGTLDRLIAGFAADLNQNMQARWIGYLLMVLWPLARLGLGWFGDEQPDHGWTTWEIRKAPVVGRAVTLLFGLLTFVGFAIEFAVWGLVIVVCFAYTAVVFPFHTKRHRERGG